MLTELCNPPRRPYGGYGGTYGSSYGGAYGSSYGGYGGYGSSMYGRPGMYGGGGMYGSGAQQTSCLKLAFFPQNIGDESFFLQLGGKANGWQCCLQAARQ